MYTNQDQIYLEKSDDELLLRNAITDSTQKKIVFNKEFKVKLQAPIIVERELTLISEFHDTNPNLSKGSDESVPLPTIFLS